ncbi:MAG: hypothetical protein Q4B96_07650 [Bacillota bacterium]|nr:hypothetical protein [Bacillota bacterium]
MASYKRSSKNGLFLMELLLAVTFFCICAAVCMQVFVTAKQQSDDSYALANASQLCAAAAEAYKGYGGDAGLAAAQVPRYYDAAWLPCEQALAVYELRIDEAGADGRLRSAAIAVYRLTDEQPLFALDARAWAEVSGDV